MTVSNLTPVSRRPPLRVFLFDMLSFPASLWLRLLSWLFRLELLVGVAHPGSIVAAARARVAIENERQHMYALLTRVGDGLDEVPPGQLADHRRMVGATEDAVLRFLRTNHPGVSPLPDPDVTTALEVLRIDSMR